LQAGQAIPAHLLLSPPPGGRHLSIVATRSDDLSETAILRIVLVDNEAAGDKAQ